MATTRAQQFREQELQVKREKRAPRPKKKPQAKPFDSRSHAQARGGAALEEMQGDGVKKPSRKSTRGSADRTKRTTNLQLKAQRATTSPKARHDRNAATRGRA